MWGQTSDRVGGGHLGHRHQCYRWILTWYVTGLKRLIRHVCIVVVAGRVVVCRSVGALDRALALAFLVAVCRSLTYAVSVSVADIAIIAAVDLAVVSLASETVVAAHTHGARHDVTLRTLRHAMQHRRSERGRVEKEVEAEQACRCL